MKALAIALLMALGCGSDLEAGGSGVDAGAGDDPLAIGETPEPGSLDDLHRTIVSARCSGQPGLCHNGQFEPNLSTPALFYEYAVGRPALEKPDRMRVAPGDPDASFLVDKLRNRDVSTRMPLGAEPLDEEDIASIEAWIRDGALRRPGADPPPTLNNPPRRPEIAVYSGGSRLDSGVPFTVDAPVTLTLRHSVSDFETGDEDIAFGAFLLQTADGKRLVLSPGDDDPGVGASEYDPDGPMGSGDLLNRRLPVVIGNTVDLVGPDGAIENVASAGLVFTVLAAYVDQLDGGIASFAISPATMEIE